MPGEIDSRKLKQLKQRPQILVKLSFRELYGSKLSGLCTFDNMAFINSKTAKNQKRRLLVLETPIIIFVILSENSSVVTNDTQGPKRYFLLFDREASWLLFSSSVSLLSGGTVQLENTYFSILQVTGQV